MRSYQQLFAELKRRKVFKVAAVYGIVAFGLIQVADPLAGALLLPDTFLTYVVAILLLGFPLALVLAWAFEVTPEGVRRTEVAGAGEIAGIVALPASQRWPAGLMALVGVGALVAGAWWVGTRTGPAPPAVADSAEPRLVLTDLADDPRPSIAVLPFADMSPEGDQEYFSDGMTEEILNVLAKLPELRVTARTSTFALKGLQLDMRAVGDSLNVRYVVEGSVRKAGDQLRITAQLIDAADGSHLWSESYDRTLENVFQIQTEIAGAIAGELRVPLGIEDPSDLVTPTADIEAYDLYLAGRARMRERSESMRETNQLFRAAIARDSSWAPAWAGLAESLELTGWWYGAWDEAPVDSAMFVVGRDTLWRGAERAARRALELDPKNASANVALGSVLRNARLWEASEEAYLRALNADPDNPEAHQQYAEMLMDVGRIAEARRAAERAVALDRAPIRILVVAYALAADDEAERAQEVLLEGLREFPEANALKIGLSTSHATLGQLDEWAAMEEDDRFRTAKRRFVNSDSTALNPIQWGQVEALMSMGRHDAAAEELARVAPYISFMGLWNPVFDPI
ncbi:MAG: tetratricopeptide repeat protein, partial [Gemmatimonadota bacterium]